MFLWGFLCGGVPWMTLWAVQRQSRGMRRRMRRRQAAQWQQMRQFLTYDGSEMPTEGKHRDSIA